MTVSPAQGASRARVPNWTNILFLSLTALGALTLTPLYVRAEGWHWGLFALFLVSWFLTNLSITAGYHRFLAHRSYDVKPLVKLAYLLVGAAAFQGSALLWSADHRRHHQFVDTDRDPHNIRQGFWWAHIGWLFWKEPASDASPLPPDLARDEMVQWQNRHYILIAAVMGGLVPLLIGATFGHPFGGFLFGGVLRVFITNHCTFFVNSLAHYWGSRPYSREQTARDSVLVAFLACGEGYHNFHHVFASDYRNGIRWYHWDPTKWLIQALALPGWTFRLKTMPPTVILRARLATEEKLLIEKGAPSDRVVALKQKVEQAQRRWRTLCDDYQALKRNMRERSEARVLQLKRDLKAARSDFKRARAQWGTAKKYPRILGA